MISGRDFYIDFDIPKGFMVPVDDVSVRAEAHIMLGTSDVTDEALALDAVNSVTWQRDSQSAAADELWTPTTESGSDGLVLLIDHKSKDPSRRKDCGPRWEEQLQTKFICTISLSTGAAAQGELGLG